MHKFQPVNIPPLTADLRRAIPFHNWTLKRVKLGGTCLVAQTVKAVFSTFQFSAKYFRIERKILHCVFSNFSLKIREFSSIDD